MYLDDKIYLGLADQERVNVPLSVMNRHGLIAGATGTGKTITMKVLAESLSDAGVPVFLCDIKGDVSGLCVPGEKNEGMEKRIDRFGIRDSFEYKSYPVCFWDVYGEKGHPVRATVSDIGPTLMSRILGLTEAQEGVLNIVFRVADDMGMELVDFKDLRSMVNYVAEHKSEYTTVYGNIATASIGAVVRSLLPLEDQGAELFFGEPMLDIRDWIRCAPDGRGYINLLDCVKLSQNPVLYSMFLLWMLSELYETLPEVGDVQKPKLVFFFDEAHMLFKDTPKALVSKIEQVIKLIRSKGVGVFFVTQNPSDIPEAVLAQLSNRIQHALRAYTPMEQKAVRAAAQAFRKNPAFNTEEMITQLGVGEALVSVLDEEGVPSIVQYTKIICPQSLMAQADAVSIQRAREADGMERYDNEVDNYTAFERIAQQLEYEAQQAEMARQQAELDKQRQAMEREEARRIAAREREEQRRRERIERELMNAGKKLIKRGIMNTIKKYL
ncbi:MAG: DUF853 family protein [Eubacteriaceae bacterium]|nr:DUF853 family protein [Eubacteriaceae bacterium]